MATYNLKWLKEKMDSGGKVDFLFFWGHTPQANEEAGKFMLSQWYPSPFIVDSITYKTAEHWMMAGKAKLFGDDEIFKEIIESTTPKDAKALGRKVKNFVPEIWDKNCFDIVVEGNLHKFSSDENLKQYLLSTGNKIIVEASPVDAIWGIGLAQDHKNASNPSEWRGLNLLGFALMEVRDKLKLTF